MPIKLYRAAARCRVVLYHFPLSKAYPDASWAHASRKIVEAEKTAPEIAREAIEIIRLLYAIEKQATALSAPGWLDLRQKQSAPVLVQLRQKLLGWKEFVAQTSHD